MGGDDDDAPGPDDRVFWLQNRVQNALRLKADKLKGFNAGTSRCAPSPCRYAPLLTQTRVPLPVRHPRLLGGPLGTRGLGRWLAGRALSYDDDVVDDGA
jgi:hypothetical protein